MFSYEKDDVSLSRSCARAILDRKSVANEVVTISTLHRPEGISDRIVFNFLKGLSSRSGLASFSLEEQLQYLALAQFWKLKNFGALERFELDAETMKVFCELIQHYPTLTYSLVLKDLKALRLLSALLRSMNVQNIKGLWIELKEKNDDISHERLLPVDEANIPQLLDQLLSLRRLTIHARLEDRHIHVFFPKLKEMKQLEKIELKGCFKDVDMMVRSLRVDEWPSLKKVLLTGNFNARGAKELLKVLLDASLNLSCFALSGQFDASDVWRLDDLMPSHIRSFKINDEKASTQENEESEEASDSGKFEESEESEE